MSTIVVAADARWVRDLVKSACTGAGQEVLEVTRGQDVRTVVGEQSPDLVILDMQIANMGGLAVTIDLRLESSAGRIPDVSILLLLDREADRFLAKRVDADAELVKPVDPGTLRRTVDRLLAREPEATVEEEMQRSRARTGGTAERNRPSDSITGPLRDVAQFG
jgi:DNA-binding response OmpR family regulator